MNITDNKTPLTQSYLKDTLVANAKRYKKDIFYLRENRFNPMGRVKPICTVLQISCIKALSSAFSALAGLSSQDISSGRYISCTHLCHSSRNWQSGEYSITDSQRSYSATSWTTGIPTPGHTANISMEIRQEIPQQFTDSTRQVAKELLSKSRVNVHCNDRHRYDRSYDLWTSGWCCRWIYSQAATRQTFICSHYFQRRPYWPIAWSGTAERQCARDNRSMAFLGKYPGKTASNYCYWQNTSPAGRGILRQRYNQETRRKEDSLCHCRQNDQTTQKSDAICQLLRIRQRMGSGRIFIFTVPLESTSSLYSHSQTQRAGTGRYPAETFHHGALHISQSVGYWKSWTYTGISLSLLLRQGLSGTLDKRVQKHSQYGKDSKPVLLGKCCIHRNDFLGIRSGACVSAPLPAKRISAMEYFHTSQRTLVAASGMHKERQ